MAVGGSVPLPRMMKNVCTQKANTPLAASCSENTLPRSVCNGGEEHLTE